MIGKEEFIELIKEYELQNNRIDDLEKIFPNCFESNIIDYGFKLFDQILNIYFNQEGSDWIYWYLCESNLKAWDENGKDIPMNDEEDLWELVKNYRI